MAYLHEIQTMKRRGTLYILLGILILVGTSVPSRADVVRDTRLALGTSVTMMVWEEKEPERAGKVIEKAFAEIERVESIFSIYREQSEISRINAMAGVGPVHVSKETLDMLAEGVRLASIAGGAFDITFAGAGRLYPFGSKDARPPTPKQIEGVLKNVGIDHLKLDPEAQTAFLDVPGAKIDLGGYIKGYAVDRACAVVRREGYSDFIVNAGGDMYVAGAKGGKSWRIGIQDPRGKRDELVAALAVKDHAVVTSGDYERFFIHEGVRYHHILDSRTGRPARRCRSVTVIADGVMKADALATIVFILGPEAGIRLIETEAGASCFVIDAQGQYHFSRGFKQACEFEKIDGRTEYNHRKSIR